MANRFLRATGNWNGSVWASTTGGAAGSAATPTSSDTVVVDLDYTVTLTSDSSCAGAYLSRGKIDINGYKLTCHSGFFWAYIVNGYSKEVDMGGGEIEMLGNNIAPIALNFTAVATITNSVGSRITFNALYGDSGSAGVSMVDLRSGFSGDVVINAGEGNSNEVEVNLYGSPSLSSLIIESKNSMAHTINLASDSTITTDKFVAIGTSAAEPLTVQPYTGTATIHVNDSTYGQSLDISVYAAGDGTKYAGADSDVTGGTGWLEQDAPKADTFVDPLTTTPGSNTNWDVTGTISTTTTSANGGGYEFSPGAEIISTDTYDLVSSSLAYEVPRIGSGSTLVAYFGDASTTAQLEAIHTSASTDISLYIESEIEESDSPSLSADFIKLSITGTTFKVESSTDGISYSTLFTHALSDTDLAYFRSFRPRFYVTGGSSSSSDLGSVNPVFNQVPVASLTSPANNTTLTTATPTLTFSATDAESEDVTYEVQIDDNSSFTSPSSFLSASDSGFSGSDPYTSGASVTYTVQSALTTGGIDYWWRVRAKDPSGSNSWGAWTTARKMTTEALPPSVTSGPTQAVTTTMASVAGNVTSANGATITERGIAYHTSTNPTTANSKQIVSGTTGSFSGNLTGLTPNTTYYWRAYATNSKGTTYGVNRSFTTEPRPPVVSTGTPSGTTIDSITVTGSSLTSNPDAQTIDEYGVVYSTSNNPTIANSKQTASGGSSSYNNTLAGLTENTTYYIRAYVKWRGSDHAYGSQVSFKTQGRPAVTLNAPAASGSTGLTRPQLTFTGTDADTNTITYQLQLHSSDTFTSPLIDVLSASSAGFANISTAKTDPFYSGNQIGYTLQTDLSRGTTYYWRVRGKDTNGTNTWGEWTSSRNFSVTSIAPSISITSVHYVTFDEAQIDAEVTSDGGESVTERGVVYSTSPNPTTADSTVTSGTGTGSFTATITSLSGSTTYYARAYAINSVGTSYSSEASFTTTVTPGVPTVVTGAAENTTDITSEFNGSEVTADGTLTVTERGIVFSDTNATPDTDDNKIAASTSGMGLFDLGITGLDASTTYYVRAYAINSYGTGYGDVETFETDEPFVPDEGDGHWTYAPSGSDANISRDQSTPEYSSVDLPLADLNLEDDEDYTLYYASATSDEGEVSVVLQWYDGGVKEQQTITAGTPYTFTYDEAMDYWSIRLFVTGSSAEADNINATFKDMYLAKESEFSGFVPFVARGLTEVKLENNWLVDDRRDEVIQSIFNQIKGTSWYPFNITTEGLGWFEIGDRFTVVDDQDVEKSVVVWNTKLTVDGGIGETLHTNKKEITETDYKKAGRLGGNIRRTQLQVDKQAGEIQSLVSDMYDLDGVVNTKYTELQQDNESIVATIQGAGGVNLIKNSVMYAFDSDGLPDSWTLDDDSGDGTLVIQASPESLTAGAVSGNAFTLSDSTVTQTISVRKDVDFIEEDDKTYYSVSARVKKNVVGDASITLTNRNETLTIELPDQTGYFWDVVTIEAILPKDDYYDITVTSDSDAGLQVTDLIFAPGKTRHEWTQANGEVMNSSVSITEDGMTIRSSVYQNNYTKIDALGFEVHKKDQNGDRIFGFNDDETNVSKLKADKQIGMAPVRIVPVEFDTYSGWAFTPSKEDS